MKIFVDENESPHFIQHVLNVYQGYGELRSARDENLLGTQDIPLFEELENRGFNAIITRDRKQLRRIDPETGQSEADKLRQCGLHWVGHSEPATQGLDLIAELTSMYLSCWPDLVELIESLKEPSAIAIKRSARKPLKAFALEKPHGS